VLEKGHAIVQRIVWEGSTTDSATYIENHVRDDCLNEALILLISHISDLETFTESVLACASISTFDTLVAATLRTSDEGVVVKVWNIDQQQFTLLSASKDPAPCVSENKFRKPIVILPFS